MRDGLHLDALTVSRGGAPLVSLDAQVKPGEILTIMGPSGSGKSTLLAAITGTLPQGFAMSGKIHLNGKDITKSPPEQRRLGLMFQDALLFPHLSVAGNLAFGMRPGANRQSRIAKALLDIGLGGFENRDPATLSGGQAARVALMRTLLSAPLALLLDEPFSRLDTDLRDQVRAMTFAQARHLPTILVTHDEADARAANGPIIRI